VEIVEVNEVRFCELEEDHWDGHEKYSSDTEMYQTFGQYYNCEVD